MVKRFLEQRMEIATHKLQTESFADLSEVKALQAEIIAYSRILGFVNGLTREAQKQDS